MPKIKNVYTRKGGVEKIIYPGKRVPGPNTIAYYKLNGNANDSSGNGYNGTATSVTRGTNYATFSSGRISIPISHNFTNLTTSYWIKTTQSVSAGDNRLVIGNYGSGDNANLDQYSYSGKCALGFWNGSSSTEGTGATAMNDGNWHNVIVTQDSNSTKLYLDGNIDLTMARVLSVKATSGGCSIGNHPGASRPFVGSISEVIIEDGTWSADDVSKYYRASKSLFGL